MSKNNNMNKLSGRYEIIEQVGIGGMIYVYKAYDTKKKRIVAIKVLKDELSLDDEFVKKFKSEALASKNIKQENVISAYDVVDEENMHYIVLEYVDGITLNKYISEKGGLSNEETINISIQVARGIEAAHNKGIIHRDIKPQNIVINDKGVAKITDFGIARAVTSTTKNISVIGTVHYISPEQVRNTAVDFRSDIYSFGCTIYEMITGEVPFEGETPVEIIVSHLRENIKNPSIKNPNIYKSLEKIILKATRMLPRERYQDMAEMIKDLELALKDKTGSYIKDSVYDDEEGQTVIITDEDMKVIKAVSERYINRNTYRSNESNLTLEQKEFIDRYIANGSFKHHQLMRRTAYGIIAAVIILILFMVFIALDTRKSTVRSGVVISSSSVTINNIAQSLEGLSLELARSFSEEYGIRLNVVGEEFNDDIEHGKIIKIVRNGIEKDKTLDIIVSKGSENIDFSDIEALNNTRWNEMVMLLNERGLTYSVSEVYHQDIPRSYIIGVNKKNSAEQGPLVFTVSRGVSDSVKSMPDLRNKSLTEVRDLIEVNELTLGNISFVRDKTVQENHVISQSIKPGKSVNVGASVDIYVSCGPDGTEYIAESEYKWHSSMSGSYLVTQSNGPDINNTSEKYILEVRLMQYTPQGTIYTELLEPQEYKAGTILPLIFTDIEGENNISSGEVQVVDVENDTVLFSQQIIFTP